MKVAGAGRYVLGMGVLREEGTVAHRVTALTDGDEGGEPTALFEEHYTDKEAWAPEDGTVEAVVRRASRARAETMRRPAKTSR